MSEELEIGTVTAFSPNASYGFIQIPGRQKDTFFHRSAVAGGWLPKVGDRVRVQVEQRPKGPAAVTVERMEL